MLENMTNVFSLENTSLKFILCYLKKIRKIDNFDSEAYPWLFLKKLVTFSFLLIGQRNIHI
jgi:hypothetical protein